MKQNRSIFNVLSEEFSKYGFMYIQYKIKISRKLFVTYKKNQKNDKCDAHNSKGDYVMYKIQYKTASFSIKRFENTFLVDEMMRT